MFVHNIQFVSNMFSNSLQCTYCVECFAREENAEL